MNRWWAEMDRRLREHPEQSRCACGLPDERLLGAFGVGYMTPGKHITTCPACGGRAHQYKGALRCEDCGLSEAPVMPLDAA